MRVPQPVRDRVRLRLPHALSLYQRARLALRGDQRAAELARWARKGAHLVAKTGMHGIRFDRDGIWIDDGTGCLWAYRPGPHSTTVWAEMHYEQAEIDELARRLPTSSLLVDVGAHVGLHSIKLCRSLPNLEVLAFEPVAETFDLLCRNAAKNGVADRIHPQRLVISDHAGVVPITSRNSGLNFVVPAGAKASHGAVEHVQSTPLDHILADDPRRVGAIKCDVEGAELMVLRGAKRTLARWRPTVLLEVDYRWVRRYGYRGEDVIDYLSAEGFRYERFVESELRPPSGSVSADLSEGCNFLFTPEH
jgi:FkbM family methyltransferase